MEYQILLCLGTTITGERILLDDIACGGIAKGDGIAHTLGRIADGTKTEIGIAIVGMLGDDRCHQLACLVIAANAHIASCGIDISATPPCLTGVFVEAGIDGLSTRYGIVAIGHAREVVAKNHGVLLLAQHLTDTDAIIVGLVNRVPISSKTVTGDIADIEVLGTRQTVLHIAERDDAVVVLDMGDATLCGHTVERQGTGRGIVGKRVDTRLREGSGLTTIVALGLEDIDIVLAGVHGVVLPCRSIVIDAPDEHALARKIGIPTRVATILKDKVLVLVGATAVDAIGLLAGLQFVERQRVGRGVDGLEFHPPNGAALIGRKAWRGAAVVAIAARAHEVPRAEGLGGIHGVVHIGQAQHMAKLMTEGADALDLGARGIAEL